MSDGPALGTRVPLPIFREAAVEHLANPQLRRNLGRATRTIRDKRARMAAEVQDWQKLRARARDSKDRILGNLDHYLDRLQAAVEAAGGRVHRASTAQEASRIVVEVARAHRVSEVVKVKSITTDEIGLNAALAQAGVPVLETDLAELIIQLAGEESSHFLVPAIHKNRTEIRDLFRVHLGNADLTDDPQQLAEAARLYLRDAFGRAGMAVSGANFAIADTGTLGVVESEGNGRMCLTLPPVLVTVMGIEKVLGSWDDLGPILQLLPRSATGERMNPYTTLWTGPAPDGPQEFHLILLDNGRRRVLADPVGRQALRCIRCSACLNSCPVYERTGGHAYNSPYPGPIGAILTPQLLGPGAADSLPFASTLCGVCREVCPVDIDIPEVLLHLRARAPHGAGDPALYWLLARLTPVLARPGLYRTAQRVGALASRFMAPGGWLTRAPGPLAGWTLGRDLPLPAAQSFRQWWAEEGRARHGPGDAGPGPTVAAMDPDPQTRAPASTPDPLESSTAGEPAPRPHPSLLHLMQDRLRDYGASVRTTDGAGLSRTIAAALSEWTDAGPAGPGGPPAGGVILPPGLPEGLEAGVREWATLTGAPLLRDPPERPLDPTSLDGALGVVTGCALGIAETGTLILDGGPGQGRRALTLLPDHHLCFVPVSRIVPGVAEAMGPMEEAVRGGSRALTLISGPSATSDIELERVQGVHGPRNLSVILLLDP